MLPALIAAGSSLIGGLMGNARAEKNDAMQREFAQSGIQWKVEDAKKAGIHPLAALGAQTVSYQPQQIGTDLSTGVAQMGQDISRAVDATRTTTGRAGAVAKTIEDLNLTKMGLENELLATQIAKLRQAGHPPPMPGPGDDISLIAGQPSAISIDDFGRRFVGHPTGQGVIPVNPAWASAQDISDTYGDSVGDAIGWDNFLRLMANQTFFGKSRSILPWEAFKASNNRPFEPIGVRR